jgi:uncharacterized protein
MDKSASTTLDIDGKLKAIPPDLVTLAFAEGIRSAFPTSLRGIILYGSRARGDAREGSDYDFLVLLDQVDTAAKNMVRDIEIAMLDRYDALVSALVMTPQAWERRAALPLGRNVAREGVAV